MKNTFKRLVQSAYDSLRRTRCGRGFANVCMARERAYLSRVRAVENRIVAELKDVDGGYVVRGGLFQGLRYPEFCFVWSEFIPKILGSYEMEVITEIARICEQKENEILFVDIGAAEGHFAVGLPYRFANVIAHAYEIQESAHKIIQNLAIENDVSDRVEIYSRFESETGVPYEKFATVLFLIDIEGGEFELCTCEFFQNNAAATIIIEIHESKIEGLFNTICRRALSTHDVARISQNRMKQHLAKAHLTVDRFSADCAVDEKRPFWGNFWAVFSPRSF